MQYRRGFGWLVGLALVAGCGPAPESAPNAAPQPGAAVAPASSPAATSAPASDPLPAPAPAPAAKPSAAAIAPTPPDSKRFPAPFTVEPAPMAGTIAFVADGDTVKVQLADRSVMVRLLGVNTPEKQSKYRDAEPWGAKVSEIARAAWLGKRVELIADLAATDKYDRVLGYVVLDGEDLGVWLLRQGYARIFEPAAHPRRVQYLKLQAAAKAAKVGVWSSAEGAVAGPVVGNRGSKVVHAPDCDYLPSPRNRVPLASRAAAEAAGYRPHSCLTKR